MKFVTIEIGNHDSIVQVVREVFDENNVDVEFWDELDDLDPGNRVNVSLTVHDLLEIRKILSIHPMKN